MTICGHRTKNKFMVCNNCWTNYIADVLSVDAPWSDDQIRPRKKRVYDKRTKKCKCGTPIRQRANMCVHCARSENLKRVKKIKPTHDRRNAEMRIDAMTMTKKDIAEKYEMTIGSVRRITQGIERKMK